MKSLTKDELLDVIALASSRLHSELRNADKDGRLEDYLTRIGMADLYPRQGNGSQYDTFPDGKIVILGDSRVKEQQVYGCLKELGISKDRVELYLSYDAVKGFHFPKIQYNPNYRLILFGPVPHSAEAKRDKSSIITQIETDDGYPKVIRLTDDHGLKITKTSLKTAIWGEIQSGYLVV